MASDITLFLNLSITEIFMLNVMKISFTVSSIVYHKCFHYVRYVHFENHKSKFFEKIRLEY